VKFLVDAQLPHRLCKTLNAVGHEAIHTTDLPQGNRTPDKDIASVADADKRTVITKDRDFRVSNMLLGSPRSLVVVAAGNISNDELCGLFLRYIDTIATLLDSSPVVEVSRDRLIALPGKPA
jgi:predicted nuclease of predicted toxin-antitoxin system